MHNWLVARAIACRPRSRIMWFNAFVEPVRVRFIGFATGRPVEKLFFAPKGHGHQPRHVKGGADGRDRPDEPNQPAQRNLSCRGSPPKNLIFRPKAAERNDS